MAKDREMIIIGAGIAGLSAGIYARMNGFSTTILEAHDRPGGMCTSWKRGKYVFDYSIHNLAGTGKESGLRQLWEELGALNGLEIIDYEEFVRVENHDGRSFTMYSDIDRTVAELRRLSPQDEELIEEHERTARRFARVDLFGTAMDRWGALRLLPHLRVMGRLSKSTLEDRGREFTAPFLQKAFPALQYGFSNMPLIVHYIFQGGLDRGDLGAIRGGSLVFSRNLEARFLNLGGEIEYRSKVAKVLVENDRATGVRLAEGTERPADVVVSGADGRTTIYDLLDGRYKDPLLEDYYSAGWWPKEQEMGTTVFLGVKRDITSEPHALVLLLERPVRLDGRDHERLDLELFSPRTGLAPEGHGVIKVNIPCDYDRWRRLREEGGYEGGKRLLVSTVLSALEPRFPGLSGQVEASDVTTLLTCERYTGTFRGLQPWPPKRGQRKIMRNGLSRSLPGLGGFYMVGQWAEGSVGISTAALSARRQISRVCKDGGRKFVSRVT